MAKSKRERAGRCVKFSEILRPNYLVICEYALIGEDQGMSLIRLIDQARVGGLPVFPPRFTVVAEFARLPDARPADIQAAHPSLKVQLHSPAGKIIDLGEYTVSEINQENPWNVHRLVLDMGMAIKFTSEGTYVFRVLAKTVEHDYEPVLDKYLPIKVRPDGEADS